MGVSQNGCLGPKKREMEIYVELIDSIHDAAEKMQIKEGSDIYLSLQSQLIKTGQIRKLADHLSSHRSKLAQSFHHNLKIVTQKRNINNRFAALIVVDSIYDSINKEKKNQENLVTEEETFAKTSTNNSSTMKMIKSYSQQKSGTGSVIEAKLEGYYFKFILYLLEYEEKMYGNLLESIDTFCSGRKEKLNCKMQISKILDIIMRHLKEDIKIDESSHTYLTLLQILKENTKEEYINEKDIMIFLKLWLKDQEKQTKDSIIEMEISKYELILRKIISRCVSSWDLTILLFHSMFVFYDQDRFSGYKVMKIEELYMRTILQHDLHSQILKSLFLYLLNYLSESSMSDRSYVLKPKYEENSNPRYQNITEKSCKINGFVTLRRWADRQYINLDEIVTYSCLALVKAYTFNMKQNSECLKQICDQFIKMTGLVNTRSKFIIINVLFEEIRLMQTKQELRKILIGLVQEIFVSYNLLEHLLPDFMNIFSPLDHQFTLESKMLIIKLLSYIVKHIGLHQLITNGESSHLSVSICEFMHSLFEGLQINEFLQTEDIIYQLKYVQSCVYFLHSFVENLVLTFAFNFLEQLSSKIAVQLRNSAGFSAIFLYFQLYLFYEGIKILGKQKFICPEMQNINSKINTNSPFPDLKRQIDQLITQLIQNTHGSVQKLICFHKQQLHKLKAQLQMKPKQYDQIAAIFNIHFKSPGRQQEISRRSMQFDTKSHFRRPSVNNSYYDSFDEKSKFEMDDSFRNILNNLHDN